jgi:hypothetical protein
LAIRISFQHWRAGPWPRAKGKSRRSWKMGQAAL